MRIVPDMDFRNIEWVGLQLDSRDRVRERPAGIPPPLRPKPGYILPALQDIVSEAVAMEIA